MSVTPLRPVAPQPQPQPIRYGVQAVLRGSRLPFRLSWALALVAVTASALTFWLPDVLRGTPVMNGSARGTVLVIMVLAVPLLAGSMVLAARGSARAVVVWLGTAAYLLYNAIMLLLATPLNQLFLLYLALLALCLWSIGTLLAGIDVRALRSRFSPSLPVRGLAVYLWIMVALNALAWLRIIVPGMVNDSLTSSLDGTGLTTNPVHVQDLAAWLPLIAVATWWLWRGRDWGYLLAGGALVLFVIEAVGVAVDQWFGSTADPTSPVAALAMTWVFLGLAAVGLVPVHLYLHNIDREASTVAGPR